MSGYYSFESRPERQNYTDSKVRRTKRNSGKGKKQVTFSSFFAGKGISIRGKGNSMRGNAFSIPGNGVSISGIGVSNLSGGAASMEKAFPSLEKGFP